MLHDAGQLDASLSASAALGGDLVRLRFAAEEADACRATTVGDREHQALERDTLCVEACAQTLTGKPGAPAVHCWQGAVPCRALCSGSARP